MKTGASFTAEPTIRFRFLLNFEKHHKKIRQPSAAMRILFLLVTLLPWRQSLVCSLSTPQSAAKTPKPKPKTAATARALAAQALAQKSRQPLHARLESHPLYTTLTPRDAAFARLLITTAERRQGQVDAIIENLSEQPQNTTNKKRNKKASDQLVHAVLTIGILQLLFLQVAPHAAVSETVEVLKNTPAEYKLKFANAILRRVSREQETILNESSELENVAPWLLENWQRTWGHEVTKAIVQAAMNECDMCLSIKQQPGLTQDESIQRIAQQFPGSIVLPQGSLRIIQHQGSISSWSGYEDGSWWLQNPSAALPAMVLYQGLVSSPLFDVSQCSVLDLCAAPGGKTAQLASQCLNGQLKQVTALEVSARRAKRLEENKQRLQLDWDLVVANGTTWVPDNNNDDNNNNQFEGVCLDVPCTATGTASKRPDVLRRSSDFQDLLATQFALACHAADNLVAVGGILVYSTCSLLKEESEDQVERLLQRSTAEGGEGGGRSSSVLETVPILEGEIPGMDAAIDANGWLRVLPGMHFGNDLDGCCDGFFVARLRRVK
jgi:16S rRNA (cytosine967-C5)-methyltransferase